MTTTSGRRLDELAQQRQRLFVAQFGRCANCGREFRTSADMEMAHRVAETKTNIKVWGRARVDHDLNKAMVCREKLAGVDCNARMNIGNRPAEAARLMEKIAKAIEVGNR